MPSAMNLNLTLQLNELLPVYRTDKGNQAVSLRDVHALVESRKPYATWEKAKLNEHRLVEKRDYVIISDLQVTNSKRGRKRVECIVPLAIAKKIALGVNTAAGDRVKDYFLHCEAIALRGLQTQSPQPTATPLLLLTNTQEQVRQVKAAASHLMRNGNSPGPVINHFRRTMRLLTSCTPSEYVKAAVARGLRVGSLSGRQLLRRLEPAKACTAAFMDESVRHGKTLEQLEAAGIPQALPAAFEAMLRAGITPAELSAS
jgi:phage anti-repressor protein